MNLPYPAAYREFAAGLMEHVSVPASPTASFLSSPSEFERWKKEVPEDALPFFIERHRFHTDIHVFVGDAVKVWADHAYVHEWADFAAWKAETLEEHHIS